MILGSIIIKAESDCMADKQNSAISTNGTFGPFLFARGSDDKTARLAALVVTPEGADPAEFRIMGQDIVTPTKLANRFGRHYWRCVGCALQFRYRNILCEYRFDS
jgi:hypothetical protein